jgi:hypothetical protein
MARHTLKSAVKRGALIAAANWQVTLIQASADSLFKLLLAAPIIGGVFLVGLAVGSDPQSLITLDSRELATTIVTVLLSQPAVLAAFLLALAVVAIGGSLFVFVIKAGTVSTLVQSDRETGSIEDSPLHLDLLARASRFTIDGYIAAAQALFPRYARLGFILMAVYVVSGGGYLAVVATGALGEGWLITALTTILFVAWITIVNLLYLLVQIVMTADDCSVATGARRVLAFLRAARSEVFTVFLVVLALVVAATGASILATAALGLVAFVPFFGLAAIPLQLVAWLLRGLVFQYLGLTAVGAYLKLYRTTGGDRLLQGLRPAPSAI